MRILILPPWLPFPPEFRGGIRIYELIKNLSRNNPAVGINVKDFREHTSQRAE